MRQVFALTAAVLLWSPLAAEEKSPEQRTEEKLDAVQLSIDFQDTPLADVASYISDFSGVHVVLDPKSEAATKSVTLSVKNLSLRNCTGLLLNMNGLEQVNWRGRLVWTSQERAEKLRKRDAPACPQDAAEADRKLWDKCATTKIDLDFNESTPHDILGFVRDFAGVNVVLEKDADETLSIDFPDVTLLDLLDFLAFVLDGELQLRPGAIVITK